jgi:uncharacterized membrane protein YeaQ/YmgE (transglycosylase-associated protein family)
MIRSALVKAVPVVGTVAAVIYTKERKGWTWAIPIGIVSHFAGSWLVGQLLGALDAVQAMPLKPAEVAGGEVKIPASEASTNSGNMTGIGALAKTTEVIDRNDNVIRLPTAMGEP